MLLGSSGHQVSFNTTVGGGVVVWNDRPVTGRLMLGVVLLKDKRTRLK